MSEHLRATIHFSNAMYDEGGRIPTFLRRSGIRGFLRIQKDFLHFDLVRIEFAGILKNVIIPAEYQSQMPLELSVQKHIFTINDVLDYGSGRFDAENSSQTIFPFHFQIKQSRDASDPDIFHSQAVGFESPSSLSVKVYSENPSGGTRYAGESCIAYSVKAWILNGRYVRKVVSTEVRFYDCVTSLPPPVCIEDFPGEYTLEQKKTIIRVFPWSKTRLAIKFVEPPPLAVQKSRGTALANFPMQAELTTKCGQHDIIPPLFGLRISWALKTHTFISVIGRDLVPTAQEARLSPFLKRTTNIGRPRQYKLQLPGWHPHPESKEKWKVDTILRLPIIEETFPTPSFTSPYVTRKYSVFIRLDVLGKNQRSVRLQFDIPLQIVYTEPNAAESGTDVLSRVPVYSP